MLFLSEIDFVGPILLDSMISCTITVQKWTGGWVLKKWHRLPRLWHRSPRLSALVTEIEVTAQSLPCAVFARSLIPEDKDFLFA